jgi:excisionase family DNA binding protein
MGKKLLERLLGLAMQGTALAGGVALLGKASEVVFPRTVKPDRIYSAREVARFLGVSAEEVQALVASGELAGRELGGRTLILGRSVTAYLRHEQE